MIDKNSILDYTINHMNYLFTLTQPFASYRADLVKALLEFPPSSGDVATVICSKYEPDFNIGSFDLLSKSFTEVRMKNFSLAPFNPSEDNYERYSNELMSNLSVQFQQKGEITYVPIGHYPNAKDWSQSLVVSFRTASKDFYGEATTDLDGSYLSGLFCCDASFFTECPCLWGYHKKFYFMERARNYTKRSMTVAEELPFAKSSDPSASVKVVVEVKTAPLPVVEASVATVVETAPPAPTPAPVPEPAEPEVVTHEPITGQISQSVVAPDKPAPLPDWVLEDVANPAYEQIVSEHKATVDAYESSLVLPAKKATAKKAPAKRKTAAKRKPAAKRKKPAARKAAGTTRSAKKAKRAESLSA